MRIRVLPANNLVIRHRPHLRHHNVQQADVKQYNGNVAPKLVGVNFVSNGVQRCSISCLHRSSQQRHVTHQVPLHHQDQSTIYHDVLKVKERMSANLHLKVVQHWTVECSCDARKASRPQFSVCKDHEHYKIVVVDRLKVSEPFL